MRSSVVDVSGGRGRLLGLAALVFPIALLGCGSTPSDGGVSSGRSEGGSQGGSQGGSKGNSSGAGGKGSSSSDKGGSGGSKESNGAGGKGDGAGGAAGSSSGAGGDTGGGGAGGDATGGDSAAGGAGGDASGGTTGGAGMSGSGGTSGTGGKAGMSGTGGNGRDAGAPGGMGGSSKPDAGNKGGAGGNIGLDPTGWEVSTLNCNSPGLVWKSANKTNYESFPAPGSSECTDFNGCLWEGKFNTCGDYLKQTKAWVMAHNIVALYPLKTYGLHNICIKSGSKTMEVTVYDTCADSDCDGCCTQNKGSADALIDVEKYTNSKFGVGDGRIQWADLGYKGAVCK